MQIRKSPPLKSFWKAKKKIIKGNKPKKQHGQVWHQETMANIENHFLSRGFKVVREPDIYWGRADLGVYKKGKKDLLIEVGTTSLFKLFINLKQMKNCIYLIVPNDNKLVEFICG